MHAPVSPRNDDPTREGGNVLAERTTGLAARRRLYRGAGVALLAVVAALALGACGDDDDDDGGDDTTAASTTATTGGGG
jgi:hypothetical protein